MHYWDYYKEKGIVYNRNNPRLDLCCLGYTSKAKMIKSLVEENVANANWIRERISETVNKQDIELMQKNPDKILLINDKTKEIIKSLTP